MYIYGLSLTSGESPETLTFSSALTALFPFTTLPNTTLKNEDKDLPYKTQRNKSGQYLFPYMFAIKVGRFLSSNEKLASVCTGT